MGCGQSKIENEEAVTRCKKRKQFMKEAVSFRNAFAAAHSSYTMSLKNTGAALSDFAQGEVINSAYLPTATTSTTTTTNSTTTTQSLSSTSAGAQPPPPPDILPPPPPPSSSFSPSPLARAVSMPEMKPKPETKPKPEMKPKPERSGAGQVGPTIIEEEDEVELENHETLVKKKRGRGRGSGSGSSKNQQPPAPAMMTSAAPMQTEAGWAEYIFQHPDTMVGSSLTPVEEEELVVPVPVPVPVPVKEEVQKPKRIVEDDEEVRKSAKVVEAPQVEIPSGGSVGKSVKKGKASVGMTGERRAGKGSVNLVQIFVELDDHFLKASECAHEVSKMLEATRLHYHSNFADNRGNDIRLSYE